MASTLGGLQCLVFTGGIGEHSAPIRQRICDRLGWLGVRIDPAANDRAAERISDGQGSVDVFVIATSEEMTIARHCAAKLAELRGSR
jgi:acetate kinase